MSELSKQSLKPSGQSKRQDFRWPMLWLFSIGIVYGILTVHFLEDFLLSDLLHKYLSFFSNAILMAIGFFIIRAEHHRHTLRLPGRWRTFTRWICIVIIIHAILQFASRLYLPFFIDLILISIGSAVVRAQLNDLSVFATRALAYSVLTTSLASIYFGGVIILRILLPTSNFSEAAIVVSTLAIAGLFYPLRTRLQVFIDRRFYRRKYDAEKIDALFKRELREEIQLDQLHEKLITVVRETLHPQTISLWLQKTMPNEISPNDPLLFYVQRYPEALRVNYLQMNSLALQRLQAEGINTTIPLMSQGELIGLLNLGRGLSGQDYSVADIALLDALVTQAAPALKVAQMVREQQIQVRARERIEQELRTARFIQHSLLPKEVPNLPGWHIASYYQPAREVGGDFYDFLPLKNGQLGLVIGDVTDKGVPAALVMATTRTMLHTVAREHTAPGEVLALINDLLYADILSKMFVTCFYAILDPLSGRLVYANAGHELPYRRQGADISELWATGMPLGIFPGSIYEEAEITLAVGDDLLFHSDGLVEAHDPHNEMFGFPRLKNLLQVQPAQSKTIDFLLEKLASFTGDAWEQEDDVTLVTLRRVNIVEPSLQAAPAGESSWQLLESWSIPSAPDNERQAIERVEAIVRPLHLPDERLDRLKTAVAEATMNAMEHGNQYQPERMVNLQVLANSTAIAVRVGDQGHDSQDQAEFELPDLAEKLAEIQTPRGWGLFLIKSLVDELHETTDEDGHTVELVMYRAPAREGEQN